MYYDPVKNIFAAVIKKLPFLRIIFYKLLDMMFLRSWYVRRELKQIREIFGSRHIEILDAGAGYAQYTYFMAKKLQPNTILAVDVKKDWIRDSQEFFKRYGFNNVSFGVEDLTEINYRDRFDLIVCVDVMEHIEEDVTVFENYFRALKPGGFLLINTPSVFGGSDVHSDEEESFIGEHAREGYSKEDFEQKLHPVGFETQSSRYSYGFWGDKAWRLGIKYPMLMLNFSKVLLVLLPFYYILTLPLTLLLMLIDFNSDNKVGTGITFSAYKPR